MSRAFLKNETADDPVVIPARAPLPPGTPNYVTPRGLRLLRKELDTLESERADALQLPPDDTDRTRRLAELNGRVALLNERIASARVVNGQADVGEVRFGATVTLQGGQQTRQFQIVGADEANAAEGRVAFTAPLARQLQGKLVGDAITLPTAPGQRPQPLRITAIDYNLTETT